MIQLQIHYNVQTPILKSKEIQAIDPLEDTSNHRLQIFLLNSIHSFNLSFLKTLVHMACLQTTTPYGGFHPEIPYEANFSFPSAGMFGRGAVIESARSSSPVDKPW